MTHANSVAHDVAGLLNAPFAAEAGGLMENALMVGLSRQLVLRKKMNITANNIANMSTTGFKVEKILLQRFNQTGASQADGPATVSFVKDRGMVRDFRTGQIEHTGRALDLALSGRGFFVVETDDGIRYTRDGRFSVDNNGTLSTADGKAVLDDSDSPIVLNTTDETPVITKAGSVQVGGQEIARLKIADFAALSTLHKTGEGRFEAPADAPELTVQNPNIMQSALERSNVVPIMEMNRMIEITRSYQSISNLLNQEQNLTRRAIQRLGSVR